MWHSCAERVVFVVFVVHAVQHGVAWMLGVRRCACVVGLVRYVSQPLVRPVVSLPEGIRYVVLWRMVERLRTLWGVRGTRYTTKNLRKLRYQNCHIHTISNSRKPKRARDEPRSTNGNAPRFGFHAASAQWPVPSRVLVDVVPCVPGPSASLRRDALWRPSRLRWPIPVHPVAPPRPARSSTKQFGEVTSSNPSKHIIRAH